MPTTFVALESDAKAVMALEVLRETPWLPNCSTRTMFLDENGFVPGPQEVVFFTCEGNLRFSSRWLRTSQRKVIPVAPDWAQGAFAVIAVHPSRQIEGADGFGVAVQNAAAAILGVKPPSFGLSRQRRRRSRRFRSRGAVFGAYHRP